jgi:hypothetical protein
MAGSLRNFQYTTDLGEIFLFKGDESNIEAVNGTTANIDPALNGVYGIPRNIRPRQVSYSNSDGTRVLRIVAVTPGIYQNPPATISDPIDAGDLTLIRKTPERITLYALVDSGLTDGDSPN